MCQEMTLQEALQKILKLKAENKELRAENIELKSQKEGIDYPKLLDDALQKIADLTTKLEKSEAENEKLNMLLEENDNEWANSMRDVKEEIQELRDRVDDLENREDDLYDDIVYPEAQTEGEAQWFDLKDDDEYEIKNVYPYDIRRKRDGRVVGEFVNKKSGYIHVALNRKPYRKHILVAKHFIPNPDHLPIVDHKDHDRTNYHVSNLRWVSAKENSKNKYGYKGQKYNYLDDLPVDCQQITLFKGWEFENYFISSDNKIWFYNGNQYRELKIYKSRSYLYVSMMDINNKHHSIGLNALIQEFN